MAYLNGEPRIEIREVDLSELILSSSTNVGVVVGEAAKGPVGKQVLVTSVQDYINLFGKPDVKFGYMGYTAIPFLDASNTLYVTRVINGATYAGAVIQTSTVQVDSLGIGDETTVTFSVTLTKSPNSNLSIKLGSEVVGSANVETGEVTPVTTDFLSGSLTEGVLSVTFATAPGADEEITAEYTYAGQSSTAYTDGQVEDVNNFDYTTAFPSALFAINAANQGAWANGLKVTISDVNEDDKTFIINVVQVTGSVTMTLESFVVSRHYQLDGYGTQQYLEDVINGNSLYITVKDIDTDHPDIMPDATTVIIAGGIDGERCTSGQIAAGWDSYADYETIDVDILMNAGYVDPSDVTVQNKIRSICESRQDCIGVLDFPRSKQKMSPTTDAVNWRKEDQAIDSSYVALYLPWLSVRDTFKNYLIPVPTSGYIGAIYASVPEAFKAPAGLNYGVITSATMPAVDTDLSYSQAQRGIMYNNGINVVKKIQSAGITVWGQKTEQVKASALDRINVRRNLNVIKRAIRKAYIYKLFENNDVFTRTALYNATDQYLSTIKAAGGLYAYQVICDETNNTPAVIDRNHIVLDVMVQPVKTAEYGILRITITSTGVNFSDVSIGGI